MEIHRLAEMNRTGNGNALPCFCTSNSFVVDAVLSFAAQEDLPVVIEATCNQVNQEGGYTGMQPADFVKWVKDETAARDIDGNNLILGGDHLGPEPWKSSSSDMAMARAKILVRDYVRAGFTKIHLDASMACGDEGVLSPKEIATRSAELCAEAESHAPDPDQLFYIIGTEVPVPGGETTDMGHISPTTASSLNETISANHKAFREKGLDAAISRIISVVVQPGADFSHDSIMPYTRQNANDLCREILSHDGLTLEAHSTDYQPDQSLSDLTDDHFVFLKVGPELTFCFREAIISLAVIERVLQVKNPSNILEIVDNEMAEYPQNWEKHYQGSEDQLTLLKTYSFSDRIRYYWDRPVVKAAVQKLIENLSNGPLPQPLVSQYFGIRPGLTIGNTPTELIRYRIQQSIKRYYTACGLNP